jgi:DNA-binding MarR family transcriptional regulator
MARSLPPAGSAFEKLSSEVHVRVVEALLKLSVGMRRFAWDRAAAAGLTPTQAEILRCIERAGARGLRMREVAAELALSAPTTTDAVSALVSKGYVTRESDENDRRGFRVQLTKSGVALSAELSEWFAAVSGAVAALPDKDEEELLRMLIEVLSTLQSSEGMPTLKMCVSCRHFSPHSSGDLAYPHRCELVGSAFADRHLRIDCPEQEPAPDGTSRDRWVRLRRK